MCWHKYFELVMLEQACYIKNTKYKLKKSKTIN